ncbi:glycosyltransferase family 9 protein [Hufsiella ginkgonis]|uniref:Glycosyl transferase n=1 Tax=Hufsiella ginkgonis TaxID=2695274 RepID=A0A7K1XX45_9SPHI|nr:glycosyltransferase family 9 protein [Hufsiella ginkgonis]MXV15388.1 glycosyl transferase [Hufsiella ginkgonis]
MKILVIRFSSIGDIVLTTPVIRCLKQQLPGAEIHFITKPAFKTVLEHNPYIDKLHLAAASWDETVESLRNEHFDHIIDLHNNLRTRILKLKLGVHAVSFNKLNIRKWLLVNFKVNLMPDVHIVDRNLDTVKFLGIIDDGKGLDYFLERDYELSELLPPSHRLGYVGIAIGAQHATKRMPVDKLVEVCRLIEAPVVLLGGKDDAERGDIIAEAAGSHVLNTCGALSLNQSACVVKMAERIITHDTGLMHIAAAFNKPITSVWGNTVPEFGMYPFRTDRSKLVQHPGLKCRPCSKIGYKKCPLGHFKCMKELDAKLVASAI